MELRHIFLITALLSIAIFVLPTLQSLFAGQHSFYNKGTSYCLKCHSDIRKELDLSKDHSSFPCENCHVLNTTSNLTHGNVVNPRCLDCHSTPPRMAPIAQIFGENNITNKESHNPFIASANTTPFMKGENEACISCHTAKSLTIKMLYADTYRFNSTRITNSTWRLSNYSKNIELASPLLIQSNETAGIHSFPLTSQLKCEKCHSNTRDELNNSAHHTYFSCASCHQIYSKYHASSTPPCLNCHGTAPKIVIDEKGKTFVASTAPVYAGNQSGADAHIPFVLSAININISPEGNAACSSCHSSFNNNIRFIRPSFIEWDVLNLNGTWAIRNLTFGPNKEVKVTKYLNGKMHNISATPDVNCTSCHEDIRQAVLLGGHSNEQWGKKHNYTSYNGMNSYCKSCHKPQTQDTAGTSPYPAYPFNSPNHGAIQITCVNCHGRSETLLANISGKMTYPLPMGSHVGSIFDSMAQQPNFVQSYLCMACKNTGEGVSLGEIKHFKIYTEPEVTIYVNGKQKYPK